MKFLFILAMSTFEFDETICLVKQCMSLTGIEPSSKLNLYLIMKFFTSTMLLIFFVLIPQTMKLYLVKNNLNDVVEILIVGLVYGLMAFCMLLSSHLNKQGNYKTDFIKQGNYENWNYKTIKIIIEKDQIIQSLSWTIEKRKKK